MKKGTVERNIHMKMFDAGFFLSPFLRTPIKVRRLDSESAVTHAAWNLNLKPDGPGRSETQRTILPAARRGHGCSGGWDAPMP